VDSVDVGQPPFVQCYFIAGGGCFAFHGVPYPLDWSKPFRTVNSGIAIIRDPRGNGYWAGYLPGDPPYGEDETQADVAPEWFNESHLPGWWNNEAVAGSTHVGGGGAWGGFSWSDIRDGFEFVGAALAAAIGGEAALTSLGATEAVPIVDAAGALTDPAAVEVFGAGDIAAAPVVDPAEIVVPAGGGGAATIPAVPVEVVPPVEVAPIAFTAPVEEVAPDLLPGVPGAGDVISTSPVFGIENPIGTIGSGVAGAIKSGISGAVRDAINPPRRNALPVVPPPARVAPAPAQSSALPLLLVGALIAKAVLFS